MSYTEDEVVAMVAALTTERLRTWVAAGWVRPRSADAGAAFGEVDVARARLLCELLDDLAMPQDAISVVLSLLDQVHGLRRELTTLTLAIERAPEDVRVQLIELRRSLAQAPGEPAEPPEA